MKLILIILCISYTTQAYPKNGKVLFTKGKVWINQKLIKKNASIIYGDILKTDTNALAVLSIKPGATIKVKPNTTLIIEKPKEYNSTTNNTYLLKAGEIFIKAKKTKRNRYQVKSKSATMGVRGTQFFVASNNDSLWMCVNEGSVEVEISNVKGSVIVNQGEGVNIQSDTLPEVKKYEWTKELNWKMSGSFKDIHDRTNLENINYNIEDMDYD